MVWRWIPPALLLVILAATGTGQDAAPPPALGPTDALNYAQQFLADVVNPITERYFRSVSRTELVLAGLTGLYEAAKVPVPKTLASELETDDPRKLLAVITQARVNIGSVESLAGTKALRASIQGVLRKLDPYSGLMSGAELRRGTGISGEYGVGLEMALGEPGVLIVKSVALGGPAQRAGVRPKDRIVRVGGKPVTPGSSLSNEPALLPTDGHQSELMLTLLRAGEKKPRSATLAFESYRPESVLGTTRQADNSWDYWVDRKEKLAYARLGTLIEGTSGELSQALQDLQQQGLRGLVLDLRWCPGGSFVESVNVAGLFLSTGIIARTRSREGNDKEYPCDSAHAFLGFSLVVLVNKETSGGAELIAAALQDHHRAVIVGQRTRGKASIQTLLPLPIPDAGLKLTNGMFLRPSGKNLHRFPESKRTDDWGVRPHPGREFPITPELSKQLCDWSQLLALRPGGSNEALDLDDPSMDPQRQYALHVLGMLLK
jgi:carboxyl-terminal processing protease